MRYQLAFALLPILAGLGFSTCGAAQGTRGFCAAAQKHAKADAKLPEDVQQVFGRPYYGVQSEPDAACI